MNLNTNINTNIDTQKLKNTLLNFLVPIIALVLMLVLVLTVLVPAISGIPRLQDQLGTKSRLETQLRDKLSALNKLVDFQTIVDADEEVVSRILASEAKVPELLTQVDLIARESGLNVDRLSYSLGEATEEEVALPYSVVNVSLGATGSYDQITGFLANLENAARLINVSTFRFATESAEESAGLFSITLVLQSPYLQVESNAVTDDPINVDVGDPDFEAFINKLNSLRFYDITADTQFVELEESTPEEIEESVEEEQPTDETPAQ